jgi:hypothetical protein
MAPCAIVRADWEVSVKEKTLLVLGAAAATLLLPLLSPLWNWREIGYVLDDTKETITAAELVAGKRPKSPHLTITGAVAELSGGIEYERKHRGSTVGRSFYVALRPVGNPKAAAPVLLKTEKSDIGAAQPAWIGLWTNTDQGIGSEFTQLFAQQGISVSQNALVVELGTTRETLLMKFAKYAAVVFALPFCALLYFAFFYKDTKQRQKEERATKRALSGEMEQARLALAQAIRPYLQNPKATVQVSANCIGHSPQITLSTGGRESPAPADLAGLMQSMHETLRRKKVEHSFITYTNTHIEDKGWKDKLDYH